MEVVMGKLSAATIVLFLILNPLRSHAQGIIHGSVRDSLSADQLKGAVITLTGTTFSTVSNMDGEFRIAGIPPGEYMLQASYLGYKEKMFLVDVKSEGPQILNIELLPIVTADNGMAFTEQARSQAEEINQQVRSNTITNVISGKTLQNMPDENIPVALSRLPGVSVLYKSIQLPNAGEGGVLGPGPGDFSLEEDPVSRVLIRGLDSKYSSITVDGVRVSPTSAKDRSVDLGIFSERDFQTIEVSKTVTSDEDGDATAGAINMTTGQAPYKRTLQAGLLGNDNRLDKSAGQYDFSGRYGERFFDNMLGVRVDANADKKVVSNEYLSGRNIFAESPPLSYTNAIRKGTGGDVLLDLAMPDGGSLEFNNILNEANTNYFEYQSTTVTHNPVLNFTDKETKQREFLSSLKGTNYLFGFELDWNAALSESADDHPFYYGLNFSGSTLLPGDSTINGWLRYTLNSPTRNHCVEKAASIDIHKKYDLSNEISGELKFGGKYRMETRSYNEYSRADIGSETGQNRFIILADSTVVAKDFTGTRFAGLEGAASGTIPLSYFEDVPPGERSLFGEYEIPLINKDALTLWRQLNFSPYYANYGPDINSYNFSEGVLAGFIMHDLSFGEWAKFITGVRIESEHNNYSGYYFPASLSMADPTMPYDSLPQPTDIYHYNKITILPNFQMILRPTDFLAVRLATYKTLIRPDCAARVPKIFRLSAPGGNPGYLNMGNPDLKNADVWNYELQTEFHGNDIGQFSIDAFYKDIDGFVQATNGIQPSSANTVNSLGINWNSYPITFPFRKTDRYYLYTYFNSSKPTRIWGFEIEHEANFRYLPGILKNIVLNYNLTFLRSETWGLDIMQIATTTAMDSIIYKKQSLDDMPRFFANVNLGYDIDGFSVRISYFYQGDYSVDNVYYYGFQIKENKFSRLDIAVKQQVLRNVSIVLNANNLTNSKEDASYQRPPTGVPPTSAPWTPFMAYRYGVNFDFGIGIDL
jgi:TonB-dependent receptor